MNGLVGRCRLSHFRITCRDGSGFTSELYANGRHQCEIIVEVIKEEINDVGVLEHVALSEQELSSIEIFSISVDGVQALTNGWSCDKVKNIYSKGLWAREWNDRLETDSYDPGPIVQRVYRYIRFSPQGTMNAITVVAHVVLDGQVYITNSGVLEGASFNSSVTIQPIEPFRLYVKDLVLHKHAESNTDFYATVYFWTPPEGVVFFENKGLDRPLKLEYEGDHFQTCYAHVMQGNDSQHKGGVVMDKVGAVMREDIFKPYGWPVYNYHVPTQSRSTTMRAFTARSRSLKVDESEDSHSTWSLIDNFGNQQQFIMETAGPGYDSLRIIDKGPHIRVAKFSIRLPGDEPLTRALYANGRHQCKVDILILVEEEQADGTFMPVELTEAQRRSVTVTRYSQNPNEPLPAGWSCDQETGVYDFGLWSGFGEVESKNVVLEYHSESAVPMQENIPRYMRCESTVGREPQRFMAKVMIDGVAYVTNPISGVGDSSIEIFPTDPYKIRANDLVLHRDANAGSHYYYDADVLYYNMPRGLRILKNRGFDNPLKVKWEGDAFQTAFSQKISNGYTCCKAGVVMRKDVPGLQLRIEDVCRAYPLNLQIKFNERDTVFRVVRLWIKADLGEGDTNSVFHVWDNYGCQHSFRLGKTESGREVELIDYF